MIKTHNRKAYPKNGTWDFRWDLGPKTLDTKGGTQDSVSISDVRPGTRHLGLLLYIGPETKDPKTGMWNLGSKTLRTCLNGT